MRQQILFTRPRVAEFLATPLPEMTPGDVMVKMEYTVISGGTERACILGMNNVAPAYPMALGYCGVGRVEKIGEAVTSVSVGDRVLVYHGCHTNYNICPEIKITKVEV